MRDSKDDARQKPNVPPVLKAIRKAAWEVRRLTPHAKPGEDEHAALWSLVSLLSSAEASAQRLGV
jgi:hypothetical protein